MWVIVTDVARISLTAFLTELHVVKTIPAHNNNVLYYVVTRYECPVTSTHAVSQTIEPRKGEYLNTVYRMLRSLLNAVNSRL